MEMKLCLPFAYGRLRVYDGCVPRLWQPQIEWAPPFFPLAYGDSFFLEPARGAGFLQVPSHGGELGLAFTLAAFLTLKPEIVAQQPIFSVGLHKFVSLLKGL